MKPFPAIPGAPSGAAVRRHIRLDTRPLLPNEPRVRDWDTQAALTDRHLLPFLAEIELFLLSLRIQVDRDLQLRQPLKHGKPYPLGQCLEISRAALQGMRSISPAKLSPAARRGQAALLAFLEAGGSLRQVWGDLRGEFFQNAFQVGTLYVDVSNDTVTATKPKVEILPFPDADFRPVEDFAHFARLAGRYWHETSYPNHVLPELAPWFPLIHVDQHGQVCLRDITDYMVSLTEAGRFRPSEEALRAPPMQEGLFKLIVGTLASSGQKLPASPGQGRARALEACRAMRDKRRYEPARRPPGLTDQALHVQRLLMRVRWRGAAALAGDGADQGTAGSVAWAAVTADRHRALRWRRQIDFSFAHQEILAPLGPQELAVAAHHGPIAFVLAGAPSVPASAATPPPPLPPVAVAVFGFMAGHNLSVSDDGRWQGGYLPAAYLAQPFTLLRQADRHVLCVDENSALLHPSEGEPLFDGDDQPAPALREVTAQLARMERERAVLSNACARLREHGLLQPWPIRLRTGQGEQPVESLYRVDEAALNALSPAALKAVQESGALTLAYAQLMSQQHMAPLVKRAEDALLTTAAM